MHVDHDNAVVIRNMLLGRKFQPIGSGNDFFFIAQWPRFGTVELCIRRYEQEQRSYQRYYYPCGGFHSLMSKKRDVGFVVFGWTCTSALFITYRVCSWGANVGLKKLFIV